MRNEQALDQRNIGYDLIRVAAMLLVLINHTMAEFSTGVSAESVFSSVCMALSRGGVPLFVMLSGALLVRSQGVDPLRTAVKRAADVLRPLVFWSLVYYVAFNVLIYKDASWRSFLSLVQEPGSGSHLWYLYMLIPLCLLLPVFQILASKDHMKTVGYVLVLWLVFSGCFHYIELLTGWHLYENLHFVSGYAGYFLAGWYITNSHWQISKGKLAVCASAALIGLVIALIALPFDSALKREVVSYTGLPMIVLSVSLFCLLKQWGDTCRIGPKARGVIALTSKVSFCVYLCQLVMRAAAHRVVLYTGWEGIPGTLLLFVLTVALSLGFSLCVYSIPNNAVTVSIKKYLGIK